MKLLWLGYLVYSFGNCAMKLCIETGLNMPSCSGRNLGVVPVFQHDTEMMDFNYY